MGRSQARHDIAPKDLSRLVSPLLVQINRSFWSGAASLPRGWSTKGRNGIDLRSPVGHYSSEVKRRATIQPAFRV